MTSQFSSPPWLPSPVLTFAVPPQNLLLPIFEMDHIFHPSPAATFTAQQQQPAAAAAAGAASMVPPPLDAAAVDGSGESLFRDHQALRLGSAALMNNGFRGDTTSDEGTGSGSSGESTPVVASVKTKVLRDAAVAGPVQLDLDMRPNLNYAPPNWRARDDEHGGHVHWPWQAAQRATQDDRIAPPATALEELFDALRAEMAAAAAEATTDDEEATRLPDVVCGAEELKSLLMAPFLPTTKPISLLVHRIGESLLLERASRYDVPGSGLSHTTAADNRKKALASKLLYYSILAESERPLPLVGTPAAVTPPPSTPTDAPAAIPLPPPLRDSKSASESDTTPPPESSSGDGRNSSHDPYFRRTLRWKFDDLSILLGSKTPLVRVSGMGDMTLQVHDHRDYVSQVEALEFWLDNVLNSIGHVALCFHMDGLVQGYRVIPTDELPHLGDVPFSPVAVQAHASRVLHWLRASCRKDGGSYVLLRSPGSKELRLYDLEDLHKYRDAAIYSALKVNQGTSPSPPPPPQQQRWSDAFGPTVEPARTSPSITAQSNSAALSFAVVPPGRAASPPLDEIDDDTEDTSSRNAEASVIAAAKREFANAFDQPIAVMCFRMAQCLPPTDAEALRLYVRALALFPTEDVPTALVRAACHVHASQFSASSGLATGSDESDRVSRYHARCAIKDLATVISARPDTVFIALHPTVAPLASALSLGASLTRLLCGAATRQCNEKRYHDVIASLAIVQGYLAHFEDVVPAGLLTDRASATESPAGGAAANAATTTPTARAAKTKHHHHSKGTPPMSSATHHAAVAPSPAETATTHSDEIRVELLATVASVEAVLGDVLRAFLEQVGADEAKLVVIAPGVASTVRDDVQMHDHAVRELSVTAEHETAEVMTLVHRGRQAHYVTPGAFVAPLSYAEALEAMPAHLAPLRRLIDVDVPNSEGLFEAACAFYQKAFAHVSAVRTAPSDAPSGSERSAIDIKRKLARVHAAFATNLGLRFTACETYCKADPDATAATSASAHRSAYFRELSMKLLQAAEAGYADAARAHQDVDDGPQAVKMAHNRSLLRLKLAEMTSNTRERYTCEEQRHLDFAASTLRDALHSAQSAVSPATSVNSGLVEQVYNSAEAALANMFLIAASRLSGLLVQRSGDGNSNDVDVAGSQPTMNSVSLREGPDVTSRLTLAEIERRMVEGYLLPAVKASKQSQRAALEVRCLQVLADTRRFFAGIEPLLNFPTALQPLQSNIDAVRVAIANRAVGERIERAHLVASTIRTAHSLNSSTPLSFFAHTLVAADTQLLLLKLLSKEELDLKVQAVEHAVGALHSVKAVLLQHLHTAVESTAQSNAATLREEANAMGQQLAKRLTDVLMNVLKLQQDQQQASANSAASGVKALCGQALRASMAPATDVDMMTASPAALCLEVLASLPNVFRSFTDNRRRARR